MAVFEETPSRHVTPLLALPFDAYVTHAHIGQFSHGLIKCPGLDNNSERDNHNPPPRITSWHVPSEQLLNVSGGRDSALRCDSALHRLLQSLTKIHEYSWQTPRPLVRLDITLSQRDPQLRVRDFQQHRINRQGRPRVLVKVRQ